MLICNREVDAATAEEINKLFFEVILAPAYSAEALEILKSKKNRIILLLKDTTRCNKQFRSLLNGVAVQDRDLKVGGIDGEVRSVTEKQVTDEQMADLIFANKLGKQSKSNAIVFAKNGCCCKRYRPDLPCGRPQAGGGQGTQFRLRPQGCGDGFGCFLPVLGLCRTGA